MIVLFTPACKQELGLAPTYVHMKANGILYMYMCASIGVRHATLQKGHNISKLDFKFTKIHY